MIAKHNVKIGSLLALGLLLGEIGGHGQPPGELSRAPGAAEPRKMADLEPLAPGSSRRLRILEKETHRFPVQLSPGQLVQIDVEELCGDVELRLEGPDGAEVPRIDSLKEDTHVEPLRLIPKIGGLHWLLVRASKESSYEVRMTPPVAPTAEDRLRVAAYQAFYRARAARKDNGEVAAEHFHRSVELWRVLKDRRREARALFELAEHLPPGTEKRSAYQRALEHFEALDDHWHSARCLRGLGKLDSRNRPEEAGEHYGRALELWLGADERLQASYAAFDRAKIMKRLGRPGEARKALRQALELVGSGSYPVHEAKVRTELAAFYHYRGEVERGVLESRHALDLLSRSGDSESPERVARQRAQTLTRLGVSLPFVEDADMATLEEARSLLLEALILRLEQKDSRGQAVTTNGLGLVLERMERYEDALAAYRDALSDYREDAPGPFGVILGNTCRAQEKLGDLEVARTCYQKALLLNRQANYASAEAQHLLGLGRIDQHLGDLEQSEQWIESAITVLESIRGEATSVDLRASYQGWGEEGYELAIQVALSRHEIDFRGGHGDRAFQWQERFRSRGLLEYLAKVRPLERAPESRLALKEEIRVLKLEMLARDSAASSSRPLSDSLETRLDQRLAGFYQSQPRIKANEPQILSMQEVQARLDDETTLLQYYLGNPRGAVWVITREAVAVRFLPPEEEIEPVARRLHSVLSSGTHRIRVQHLERLATELSEMILDPVADLLETEHLVVIPSGSLRSIPFAVLPNPRAVGSGAPRPLLEEFRVSSAPSASVVAAMRRAKAKVPPPQKLLALLASPVFRSDDPRLAGRPVTPAVDFVAPPLDLTRELPFTDEEAERILGLLDGEEVLVATGFEADRGFVVDPALRDYQILHFATHGHLDENRGELSGLVLSQFDSDGRQQTDGLLWAYEIYDLDLSAELVVLSACETGLGENVPGEGLVGLTHAFYFAGVERALVSLWKVDDRATARLMELFYEGLLRKRQAPAEALRRAQLRLRAEGWSEPYYWGSFILDGEWLEARLGGFAHGQSEKKSP